MRRGPPPGQAPLLARGRVRPRVSGHCYGFFWRTLGPVVRLRSRGASGGVTGPGWGGGAGVGGWVPDGVSPHFLSDFFLVLPRGYRIILVRGRGWIKSRLYSSVQPVLDNEAAFRQGFALGTHPRVHRPPGPGRIPLERCPPGSSPGNFPGRTPPAPPESSSPGNCPRGPPVPRAVHPRAMPRKFIPGWKPTRGPRPPARGSIS